LLSLARDGYTAAQVDSALHSPTRKMYFRYDLLDSTNTFRKTLTTVTDGSIAYDTTQQIKRTAQFTLQDDGTINYLSDRIKPWARMWVPGDVQWSTQYEFLQPTMVVDTPYQNGLTTGGWVEFPLGVFLLSTPPRQTDSALVVTRQIVGYDLNQILVDWKTTDRMTIPAGTNYVVEVKALLEGAGITDHNLTATTYTLPTDLDYAGGTAYLKIINDLLTAINYRTLWFDADGVAVALPWANPSTQPASYTYVDDSQSVIYPQVNQLLDLFAVPNVWVVVVAQTDTAEIISNYTNSNPNSPTSTANRGREIVHYEQNLNAPLSEALDQFAAQLAFTDSQVYETVVFPSAIMPFHEDQDVIQLTFSALGISDKYSEVAWSFPLVAGGQMSHSVRKVVSV